MPATVRSASDSASSCLPPWTGPPDARSRSLPTHGTRHDHRRRRTGSSNKPGSWWHSAKRARSTSVTRRPALRGVVAKGRGRNRRPSDFQCRSRGPEGFVVARGGVEPPTFRFSVGRSSGGDRGFIYAHRPASMRVRAVYCHTIATPTATLGPTRSLGKRVANQRPLSWGQAHAPCARMDTPTRKALDRNYTTAEVARLLRCEPAAVLERVSDQECPDPVPAAPPSRPAVSVAPSRRLMHGWKGNRAD